MVGYRERFPLFAREGVLGMSRGSTPRHAQMAGFAVQLNAETLWHFVQLRYPRVG